MGVSVNPPARRAGALLQAASSRNSSPPQALVAWPADGLALSAKRRSQRACFEHFLADARAIPAQQVVIFRGNARLALANVCFGLDTACADRDAVERHLPRVNLAQVVELPDLARGLVYATTRMVAPTGSEGEARRRLALLKELREPMTEAARTMARKKLCPLKEVPQFRKDGGLPAMASHAVALAAFYGTHADRLRGNHPFSDEDIRALGENGEWLLENLKHARTPDRKPARTGTPADDRDRFWTLLTQRHVELRRVGAYFHPNDVDEVVPPLLSGTVAARDDESDADEDDAPDAPANPA